MKSGNRNDLFISDRKSRNAYDFEGSGIGNGRYDEKKEFMEKVRNSTLPIVLLIVTSVFTVFFMKDVFHYLHVISHYTKAVVEQNVYGGFEFRTPDGAAYNVSANMDVYYPEENYEAYEEIPKNYIWGTGVVVIVAVYVLIIRSLYKTFHQTHHSEKRIESYNMDD